MDELLDFLRDNASLLVALAVLVLTLQQSRSSRLQARMAIRPHLVTTTQANEADGTFRCELMNNGLGPAQLLSVQLAVDGQPRASVENRKINMILREIFPNHVFRSSQTDVGDSYVMAAGEKITLLDLTLLQPEDERVNVVNKLNRIDLKIRYESFLKDRYLFSSKDNSNTQLLSPLRKMLERICQRVGPRGDRSAVDTGGAAERT